MAASLPPVSVLLACIYTTCFLKIYEKLMVNCLAVYLSNVYFFIIQKIFFLRRAFIKDVTDNSSGASAGVCWSQMSALTTVDHHMLLLKPKTLWY